MDLKIFITFLRYFVAIFFGFSAIGCAKNNQKQVDIQKNIIVIDQINGGKSYSGDNLDLDDRNFLFQSRQTVVSHECSKIGITTNELNTLLSQGAKVVQTPNNWRINLEYQWQDEYDYYSDLITGKCIGRNLVIEGKEEVLSNYEKFIMRQPLKSNKVEFPEEIYKYTFIESGCNIENDEFGGKGSQEYKSFIHNDINGQVINLIARKTRDGFENEGYQRRQFWGLILKKDNTGYSFFLDEVPLDQINPAKYDFETSFSWSKTTQNKYKVKWDPVSIDCAIDANGQILESDNYNLEEIYDYLEISSN